MICCHGVLRAQGLANGLNSIQSRNASVLPSVHDCEVFAVVSFVLIGLESEQFFFI